MNPEPGVEAPLTRRKILENLGSFVSGAALARVLSAASIFVIARQISPVAFGQYAPSLSIVVLSSVLFTWGLDGWLLRTGGREQEQLNQHGSTAFAIKLVAGALWLLLILALRPLLNEETYPFALVFYAALSVWFENLASTVWSIFKATLRNDIASLLMVVFNGVFLLITLILAWQRVDDPAAYLMGRAGAAFVSAILAMTWFVRLFGWQIDLQAVRRAVRETAPFGVSVALALTYSRADVNIVANYLGAEASSRYVPASTLVNALFLIPQAGYTVMLPLISRSHAQDSRRAQRLARSGIALATGGGILLGAAIALLATPAIRLVYGEAYLASAPVLSILGFVLTFRCVSFAVAAVLVAVGWQSRRVVVQLVTAVVNVGLNLIVVRTFGIIGVAWVYVVSESVLVGGYLLLLYVWQRREQVRHVSLN